MKFFIIASVLLIGGVLAADETCDASVSNHCSTVDSTGKCSSVFGTDASNLNAYADAQLRASFRYLSLATNFNSYKKDRPGFEKLFNGLSEKAFDNAIKLIKYTSKRGFKNDFLRATEHSGAFVPDSLDLNELQSVGTAQQIEKKFANWGLTLAKKADAETTHFLQEEFLEPQADTIRKLTGYVNDLMGFKDKLPLGLYLFDEYLQKQ